MNKTPDTDMYLSWFLHKDFTHSATNCRLKTNVMAACWHHEPLESTVFKAEKRLTWSQQAHSNIAVAIKTSQNCSIGRSFAACLSVRRYIQTQRLMGCHSLLALIIEGNMSLPLEAEWD